MPMGFQNPGDAIPNGRRVQAADAERGPAAHKCVRTVQRLGVGEARAYSVIPFQCKRPMALWPLALRLALRVATPCQST